MEKTIGMAGSQPADTESFEYMLLEKDPGHYRTVFSVPSQISPWIDPAVLNLKHRIGSGPFGDVWIATHYQRTEDYDRYHEVAVKMLHTVKDDQLQVFSTRSSANVRAWAMFASYMASRHRMGGSVKGIAPLPRPSRTPSALCSATTTGSSSRISARTTPAGRSTTLRAPTSSW